MSSRQKFVFEKTGEEFVRGRRLGDGREGIVFEAKGRDDAVKFFRTPTAELEEKVRAMLAAPPRPTGVLNPGFTFTWPTDLVRRANGRGKVVGYAMPLVRYRYTWMQMYTPDARGPEVDRPFLLRAAKNAALGMTHLHRSGGLIGNLHATNVVVGHTADVTFLDTDSFQIRAGGKTHRCTVGTEEFTARELFGRNYAAQDRTPETDAFALAVCIWLALMEGNHPFAARYTRPGDGLPLKERIEQGVWAYASRRPADYEPRPMAPTFDSLPRELQQLFRAAFEAGHRDPAKRPKPADWVLALAAFEAKASNPTPVIPSVRDRISAVVRQLAARVEDLRTKLPVLKLPSITFPPAARKWGGLALVAGGASALTVALLTGAKESSPPPTAPPNAVRSPIGPGEATPRIWDEVRRKQPSATKSP